MIVVKSYQAKEERKNKGVERERDRGRRKKDQDKPDRWPSLPSNETMNNLSGAARRVTRNLDQFSVICVFGSVVGCVVLPLMIQVSYQLYS